MAWALFVVLASAAVVALSSLWWARRPLRAAAVLAGVLALCTFGIAKQAAADAICEGLNNQLAEIPEPQTPEEMTTTGAEVTELTRNTIDELRALVPTPEEDTVAELLDAFDAVADTGEEFLQAAADGEPPEQLFRDLTEAADTADQLEAAYGLQVCLWVPE